MKRRLMVLSTVGLLLFLVAGTVSPLSAADQDYFASQYDVVVDVDEGGSLLVTERVTYHFAGDPFTYVFREIPTDHTDGVTVVRASMDGIELPQGTEAGRVEIKGYDPLKVTWHMPPTSGRSRTFELVYRMDGVVRQSEGSDLLRYQVLPDDYAFPIDRSTTRIEFPAGASLVAEPVIMAGEAVVEVGDQQVALLATELDADQPLVVELRFEPGTVIGSAPAWQARQQERNALGPLWIAAALAVLLIGGAGTFILVRPRQYPIPVLKGHVYSPPSELPPAISGTLISPTTTPGWSQALATLFSLAERGIVKIKEVDEKKWYRSRDFAIELQQQPVAPLAHEQQMMELLFQTKNGSANRVKLSDLSQRISGKRWKKYEEAVRAEMKAAGFLSPEQQQTRNRLTIAGFIFLGISVASMILAIVASSRFGPWPLLVTGALFLLSIFFLILAYSHRPLSEEGAREAAAWQRFQDYLKEITKDRAPATRPDLFEVYLPYAAAFDLLGPWAKHFEKEGQTVLPVWFDGLANSGPDNMAAFVAMSAAASSSGGSAAGAAGAGAAGGGAAGAG